MPAALPLSAAARRTLTDPSPGRVDLDRGFDSALWLPYSQDEGCPPGRGMPCGSTWQEVFPPTPLFDNNTIGYSSNGGPSCLEGLCQPDPVVDQTWGEIKAFYR